MSDCPSTSLVKMPSGRVAELASAAIARCVRARTIELQPFEAAIAKEMARRAAVTRRWLKPKADRATVIGDLASDWSWSLNYTFAKEAYSCVERKARRLLLASSEAEEVWVSTADLWAVSP